MSATSKCPHPPQAIIRLSKELVCIACGIVVPAAIRGERGG